MTKNLGYKIALYFWFHGEGFDPVEISRALGIEPDVSFKPGDPITKDGKGRRLGYGWMVKADGEDALGVDDLFEELRRRVDVDPIAVKKLCRDLKLTSSVVCGVSADAPHCIPPILLPPAAIKWAAGMGVSINVDVMV